MNPIITYFFPVVLVLVTFFIQYRIDHKNLEPTKKSKRAITVYILSGGMLLFTAFTQYGDELNDIKSENELKSKLDTISIENKLLQNLYIETRDSLSKEINELEDTLNLSSKKIIHLYGDMYDQSTFLQKTLSGEGLAFITRGPTIVDSLNNYKTSFYVQNLSEFPIYNFTVTIYDYENLMKKKKSYNNKWYIYSTDYNSSILFVIGPIDLNPNEKYRTKFLPEEISSEKSLLIATSRNGFYYEKIIQYFDSELRQIHYAYQLLDNRLNILQTELFSGSFDEYIDPQLIEKLKAINIEEFQELNIQTELWYDN